MEKHRLEVKYFCLLIFLMAGLLFDQKSLAITAPAQLYISQVQITGGVGKTEQDFIELFNPNASPVNLKGYRLVKRSQNSQTDTDIKSWTKDDIIPAKSFFLWANSGYTSIIPKADVVTSATLSEDNGVALRFGADNTGQLIDGLAWSTSHNGFNLASNKNPQGGQAIFRLDLYAVMPSYNIAPSTPRNSLVNDLTAAFAQSQSPQPISNAQNVASQPPINVKLVPVATTTLTIPNPPAGEADALATSPARASIPILGQPVANSKKIGGMKYLILSVLALLALILITKLSIFKKRK